MAIAIRTCKRCGKVEEVRQRKVPALGILTVEPFNYSGENFIVHNNSVRFLCSDCYEEFLDWFGKGDDK